MLLQLPVLFIMMRVRGVERILRAYATVEGAGVKLHRAFGNYEVPQFDPFLLLDDFRAGRPEDYLAGFPWHPHRGIETVTYMIEGTVEHGDSMGHSGNVNAGDVQWMTAGIRDHPPGDATTGERAHGRVPALGEPARSE